MSEKPQVIENLNKQAIETRKSFAGISAAAIFGLAIGGGFGFNKGQHDALQNAKIDIKTMIAEQKADIVKTAKRDAFYAADSYYSNLCWTMRQAADKGAKTATKAAPYIVEMNQITADKCPMTPNKNIKVKIVY